MIKQGCVFLAVVFLLMFLSFFFAHNESITGHSVGDKSSLLPKACKNLFVVVDSLGDEAAAKRLQVALVGEGVVLEVRRAGGFVGDMRALEKSLFGLSYEELNVIVVGGVEIDWALVNPALLTKIAETYFFELGTLQHLAKGQLSSGLKGLVDEGVLFPWQAEKLRTGVPLVMGGLSGGDAQRIAFWQLRDHLIDYSVDYFMSNPSSDVLSFTFGSEYPAHDIVLTKERWNEFLDKHVYGSSSFKTQLPAEFRSMEVQKELLKKILKLTIREKGKELRGGTYRLLEKRIVIKEYDIFWIIGFDIPTATLVEIYPKSIKKIAIKGR